ncbi:MAG: DUF6580 family putative transport protein [Bacteroidales bacterium]
MNKKIPTPKLTAIITIIAAGALMRFIPHWPNFTPIAAMALFGGAYLGRKALAFVIPLAAMFLSDLIIGFHQDMVAVYIAFTFTVLLGWTLTHKKISAGSVITRSLAASILFFLVTNFSAWLSIPMYPKNVAGLLEAYAAGLVFFNNGSLGISFFLNEVTGTLFFSGVLFGAYALAKQQIPAIARAN